MRARTGAGEGGRRGYRAGCRGPPAGVHRNAIAYALSMSTRAVVAVLGALAALWPVAVPASAFGSDASATSSYLQADVALTSAAAAKIPHGEAILLGVLAQVRGECPKAAAGSPQDPESTQLSNEVIGAMVTAAIHPILPNIGRFVAGTSHLRWSSGSVTRSAQGYVGSLRTMAGLAPPHLCADVRSWAASGFKTLPPSTVAFDNAFVPNWVSVGEMPAGIGRFESGGLRSLARRAVAHETELTDFEAREVETWGHIMDALELSP